MGYKISNETLKKYMQKVINGDMGVYNNGEINPKIYSLRPGLIFPWPRARILREK